MPKPLASSAPSPLAGLELQVLVVLDLLLELRNVTEVAKRLRVSQSAMSHTLRRLRAVFDDPLLVRGRAEMALTPRAQALREPLRSCLRELEALFAAEGFDPKKSTARFRISATDFLASRFAPRLVRELQEQAPRVSIELKSVPLQQYAGQLERGELDLMIAGVLVPTHLGLMRKELGIEEMACAVRRGHPRVQGELTLAQYVRESHLLFTPAQQHDKGVVDQELERLGLRRSIAMYVTSFLLAPHVVAESDLVLTAPRSLLETYAALLGLQLFAPPLELEAFPVRMLWHERAHADAAQAWLRAAVQRAFAASSVAGEGGAVALRGRRRR